ncbi:MAG: hypothetical protein H7A47_11940 [Verrucomicrobiales bacterium]|nr:hypothetical protein [Verrucomicrobiales bacterium]
MAKPAEDIETLVQQAQELLPSETHDAALDSASPTEEARAGTEVYSRFPDHATGQALTWLHDFLKKQCGTDDLSSAVRLGLQRTKDKTTNRYLWVHHTQT